MKRTDIEIGVEYAKHGALAYGKIPQRVPERVRFLSKDPNVRLVHRYQVQRRDDRYPTGAYVDSRVTLDYHHLPLTFLSAAADAADGDLVEFIAQHIPGGLSAEIYKGETMGWRPTIVAPAEVHMTWQEYEDKERERVEARRQAQIDNAPHRFREAMSDMMEQARLAGYSARDVRERVDDALADYRP